MSDKKWTRRAAIGFIGAGTGLFATDTAGFTQIEGVRDVDLGSEEDPGGLVGFSAGTDVSGNPDERVDLFTLKNNFSDGNNSDDPLSINNIVINTGNEYVDNIEIGDERISQNAPIDIEDNATVNGVLRLSSGVDEVKNEEAKFEISASQNGVRFELDRSITVTVQQEEFYGNSNNYSDTVGGEANRPGENASGEVIDPENIGKRSDSSKATLQANGGLKVGFRLPPISSADCYTLTIERKKNEVTGNLQAYIVGESKDDDNNRLTRKIGLKGKNINISQFRFNGDIADEISTNKDELYLIFEDGTSGKTTNKIKFIELQAGC